LKGIPEFPDFINTDINQDNDLIGAKEPDQ